MDKNYYIYSNNVVTGPFTEENIKNMLSSGAITASAQVQDIRTGKWASIGQIPAFDVKKGGNRFSALEHARIYYSDAGQIRFECPGCRQHFSAEKPQEALKLSCSKCKQSFIVDPRSGAGHESVDLPPAQIAGNDLDIPDGELRCPHCWLSFDRDHLLYIAVHPALIGDPVLGEFEAQRFVPTVYNAQGQPLDAYGIPAVEMACPRCHLRFPAGLMDNECHYISIAGAVSSGKSYFITSLIHRLRAYLPRYFNGAFFDTDPRLNETVNGYEKQLFMSLEPDKITALPATQISGDGVSDRVLINQTEVELPKPFVFDYCAKDGENAKNIVFYDNSGEMFIPGRDEYNNQATSHLSCSNGIMFVFDPVNDASMRSSLCDKNDPQVSSNPRVVDQTSLLCEMISRIRRHKNMLSSAMCEIPLCVVVAKYDVWRENFCKDPEKISPIVEDINSDVAKVNMAKIMDVSFALRQMMLNYAPGLVNAAESFFTHVYYVPVSNFGNPAKLSESGYIGVIPSEIKPIWVETPFLILASQSGILPTAPRKKEGRSEEHFRAKIHGGRIVFEHPVTGEVVRLPASYAGVRLEIDGKYYDLPEIPKGKSTSSNVWR